MRFERDQVVVRQILEAIGERVGHRPRPLADQHDIDELLLVRQVGLLGDGHAAIAKEIDPGQAEEVVIRSLLAHFTSGHRLRLT